MSKPSLEDLFLPGTFVIQKVDLNDPEFKEKLKRMHEQQAELEKQKKVDYVRLERTYMTI